MVDVIRLWPSVDLHVVTKVSEQTAHSIFISTLKMEAALFSDTSVTY